MEFYRKDIPFSTFLSSEFVCVWSDTEPCKPLSVITFGESRAKIKMSGITSHTHVSEEYLGYSCWFSFALVPGRLAWDGADVYRLSSLSSVWVAVEEKDVESSHDVCRNRWMTYHRRTNLNTERRKNSGMLFLCIRKRKKKKKIKIYYYFFFPLGICPTSKTCKSVRRSFEMYTGDSSGFFFFFPSSGKLNSLSKKVSNNLPQ